VALKVKDYDRYAVDLSTALGLQLSSCALSPQIQVCENKQKPLD
jgi:hypothetical protein